MGICVGRHCRPKVEDPRGIPVAGYNQTEQDSNDQILCASSLEVHTTLSHITIQILLEYLVRTSRRTRPQSSYKHKL